MSKTYQSRSSAGGFHLYITLILNDADVKIECDYVCMGNSRYKYSLHGEYIHKSDNYILAKFTKFNDNPMVKNCLMEYGKDEIVETPIFMDIFLLNNKSLTDDMVAPTEIHVANTPMFDKYFNCVINLNDNILWEP